jgi:hypothetical protein
MNFDGNTIGILLIVAGALWGIWEIFKRLPKSQLAPEQDKQPEFEGIQVSDVSEEEYFFIALLGHIRQAEGPVKKHLIEAGIAKLQSYNSDKSTDGNNPTT